MGYSHTQSGPIWMLMVVLAIATGLAGAAMWQQTPVGIVLGIAAGVFAVLALSMANLTVEDRGDSLRVRYGPVPLFGKTVAYRSIRSVHRARSALVDGLGIHYVPGRGWTYNLWGRDCVELDVDGRRLRIGSDDSERLAAFIATRVNGNRSQ